MMICQGIEILPYSPIPGCDLSLVPNSDRNDRIRKDMLQH